MEKKVEKMNERDREQITEGEQVEVALRGKNTKRCKSYGEEESGCKSKEPRLRR